MQKFIPGQRPSARALNDLGAQAERVRNYRTGVGSTWRTTPGAVLESPDVPPFWAQLTQLPEVGGSGSGAGACEVEGYGWVEVQDDGCGNWFLASPGRSGTTTDAQAYEVNNRFTPLTVTDADGNERPTVVRLHQAQGGDTYLFQYWGPELAEGGSGSGNGPCPDGIPVALLFDPITCMMRDACLAIRNGQLVLLDATTGTQLHTGDLNNL